MLVTGGEDQFEDCPDENVAIMAYSIKSEIKVISVWQMKGYVTHICSKDAMEVTSETLMTILMELMPKEYSVACIIGNIVTGMVSKMYTPLQVSLCVTLHHAQIGYYWDWTDVFVLLVHFYRKLNR